MKEALTGLFRAAFSSAHGWLVARLCLVTRADPPKRGSQGGGGALTQPLLLSAGQRLCSDAVANIRVSQQNFDDAFRKVFPSVSRKVRGFMSPPEPVEVSVGARLAPASSCKHLFAFLHPGPGDVRAAPRLRQQTPTWPPVTSLMEYQRAFIQIRP